MAALPRGLPPLSLTCVSPGHYRDEKQRLWMVTNSEFTPDHNRPEPALTVKLWQMNEFSKDLLSDLSSCLDYIPYKWEQYSLVLYWGTDSRFWKLMDHIQIGNREQLVLKLECTDDIDSSSGSCPLYLR